MLKLRLYAPIVLLAAFVALASGCGIAWYVGQVPAGWPGADASVGSAAELEASAPSARPPHRLGTIYDAGFKTGNGPWFYTAGVADTVTVPVGACVTGIFTSATAAGATLTITPAGPSNQGIVDGQAGPAIPIPAGQALNLGKGLLDGTPTSLGIGSICPLQLGVGSVLVFSGTNAYWVGFYEYGGP